TSVLPSIWRALSPASAGSRASRTPPLSPAWRSLKRPLPRPPAWICALTTLSATPSSAAAASASSGVNAAMPRATGAPKSRRIAFAWYSWMFIGAVGRRLLGECRNDLHAGLDQPLDRVDRSVEHRALRLLQVDLDDPLDALGADHHRDADIAVAH